MQTRPPFLCILLLGLLPPALSHAQAPTDAPARASALIVKGNRAWQAGDLERAQRHYDDAWALAPSQRLLYRRAQVLEARGLGAEAAALYTLFLERDPQALHADAIKKHIQSLSVQAPAPHPPPALISYTLRVTPSFATVWLDGNHLPARSPYLFDLTPGPHNLLVSAQGYRPVRRQIQADADLPPSGEIVLDPEAPEEPSLPEVDAKEAEATAPEPDLPLMEVDIEPPGWAKALSWGMIAPGTLITVVGLLGLTQEEPVLGSDAIFLLGPAMLAGSSIMLFVIDWPIASQTPLAPPPTPSGRVGGTVRFSF